MDETGARTFAELIAATRGAGQGRWRAIADLGKLPSVDAWETLVELAASPDWTVRRAATESLGHHPLAPARGIDLLRAALKDPSSYVVHGACSAIASAQITSLRCEVAALLRSPSATTRLSALLAIDALWSADLAQRVMDIHRGDADEHLRRQAAFILYSRATLEWWPTLVEMWRTDSLARHRVWACQLAGRSGSSELRDAVRPLVNDADGHVRKAALAVSPAHR